MFDDLRQQASESDLGSEEHEDDFAIEETRRLPRGNFLGMTPFQRFFIAVMLLMWVCVIGAGILLITEKVSLSF